MTSLERVMAALNQTRPDRIPRYEILFPSFAEAWRREKGLPADADPATHYRIDIPSLLAVQAGPLLSQALPEHRAGAFLVRRDSWGRTLRRLPDSGFLETAATAVADKGAMERLPFEDPTSPAYAELVPDGARGSPCRHARVSGTMGLFQACTWLRGEIPFMVDLLDDESFCRALIKRVGAFLAPFGALVARRTGTVDSAFWVYDDFSINTGPMISPDLFERLFLDAYRKLLGHWKGAGVRHLVLHHDVLSEATFPILDLFLEAGITAVQGVYPTAGLSLRRFRERYGRRLAVIGGMCNTHTLPFGTRRDIEREIAAVVDAAAEGGVIIGSHSIEGYVPVRNYDLYVNALDAIETKLHGEA